MAVVLRIVNGGELEVAIDEEVTSEMPCFVSGEILAVKVPL